MIAEILLEDKARKGVGFARKRGTLGVVGDSISDAPALAAADIDFIIRIGA